ncbi:hypothetical protein [Halorubrum sp. DTA98]|uniref:hypothetical protein n=1 Tax=Halorubrum sp. DTA98 TaxID=3402163 RepID=UPI003AAC3482
MSRPNEPESAAETTSNRFREPPIAVRDGIASWTTTVDPPGGIDADTLSTLRAAMADEPLRDALATTFSGSAASEGTDGGESGTEGGESGTDGTKRLGGALSRSALAAEYAARDTLFVDPADAWRIPVADSIGGRCLDVNAGFGTRSLLLAELATTVDAVDTELASLSFLAARDDYASADRVTPIHAEPTSLPAPSTPYDTVVADLAGRHRPDSLAATVDGLTDHLSPSGALLLLLDGWPRLGGVTDAIDLGEPTRGAPDGRSISQALRTGVRGYERRLSRMGFDEVDLYALVPDSTDPSSVIPVDDPGAIRRLLDTGLSDGTTVQRLITLAASGAHGTGVLDRCWPAYLAVCHVDGDADGSDRHGIDRDEIVRHRSDGGSADDGLAVPDTNGLVTRGGGRSTVLVEDADGSLAGVTKVPHRRAHAEFTLDEVRTMRELRESERDAPDSQGILDEATSIPVPRTIPEGSLTMTRFGPTYSETPARGAPLSGALSRDPERFRRVLELGFDWLVRLQSRYGTEPANWSPAVVRDELRFPEFGLEPPSIDDPIRLFKTPCHGDFHPKNVFVDGNADGGSDEIGPVTAVIDWELGDTAGNPIADPGFFVLQTARLVFGGLEAGIDAAFTTPGPYADAVRDVVGDYCDAVGIERRAFVTCLPVVWIHRLRRCAARGATASYSARAVRRANDVRVIRDHQSAIATALGVE